jgi:hypothetical protein
MPFRTIGIDDTEVTQAEDVGIGNDEGTIDILGNIDDVEFGKALDNTVVGGFDCIGDEGGAVNNRDVVGMEFAEDCATLRLIMAVESGGPC